MASFRPLLAAALAGAFVFPAVAADDVDEALVPCEVDVDVLDEGTSATYDSTVGGVPTADAHDPVAFSDITSLAGSVGETAIKATITATLTYDTPGDLELHAYDASGTLLGSSTAFNPTDGNSEQVILSVDPCEEVRFAVENYLGVPGSPIQLDVTVEGKRPRVRG